MSSGCRSMVLVMVVMVVVAAVGEAAPSLQGDGGRGMAAFRRSLYGAGTTQRRANNQCTADPQRQYLCEMCAKETKSLQVYTLCCNGADDAQAWCQSFLVYGISGV